MKEARKRDYKDEYKKFQSSAKSKKYRAELNKYNRKKGTYGNGDDKDASHKGGKIVGFESQSKNRGRAEKSRLKQESLIYEIPASVFSAAAAVKLKNKAGKEVSAATAAKSDYAKKDPATHKKAKSIFQRLKDKFSKKKDDKKPAPKKQSKSDADFYKRQYESVNEDYKISVKHTFKVTPDGGIILYGRHGKIMMNREEIKSFLRGLKMKHIPESVNEAISGFQYQKNIIKRDRDRKAKEFQAKQRAKGLKWDEKKKRWVKKESVNESRANVVKAIAIAKKMSGNMTGAVKKIEKIQKGLSKQIEVEDALRKANESVNEAKSKTIKAIGSIIGKRQAKKIDGVLVDMQTANVIMKVWNALSSSNRKKYEKLKIGQMAKVAWKLVK